MRLVNKVALVSASTRGIGWAGVQRLAKEGAIVYMGARDLERANARASELNAQGWSMKTVYNDASKKESYASMVEVSLIFLPLEDCTQTFLKSDMEQASRLLII